MTCDYCQKRVEPRKSGGSKQRFCHGGQCRKKFFREARRVGAKAMRRQNRSRQMVDLGAMTPAERRRELGLAARRMGVIGA